MFLLFAGLLVVSSLLYLKYFHPLGLFFIPYSLYAHTRVGKHVHSQDLKAVQGKAPHSTTKRVSVGTFIVRPIAILKDNYAYLLIDPSSGECALVDPSDANEVVRVLQAESPPLKLTTVLTTHKHWDHAGGNEALLAKFPGLVVVGGASDRVPFANKLVKGGDTLRIGSIEVQCLNAPCHTRGHVMYLAKGHQSQKGPQQCLFTGDTLFAGGCGSFFEGNAAQMAENFQVVRALGDDTALFCGHEYTLDNLRFSVWLEPSNAQAAAKLQWAQECRLHNDTTMPTTVRSEVETNPFMRVHVADVARRVTQDEHASPTLVMAQLRKLRDLDPHLAKA